MFIKIVAFTLSVEAEDEFLKKYNAEEFKRPSVAVDILVFTIKDDKLKLLLIKRGAHPFKGMFAIPGGFVGFDESLEHAAMRELFEETNVSGIHLEQFHTFGEPKRDPRTRVISVAFISLINSEKIKLLSRADAADAQWINIDNLPKQIAFDHKMIIDKALEYLRDKIERGSNIPFQLLPEHFTLTELQHTYEIILDKEMDKRNFRKKTMALDILKSVSHIKTGKHRPAQMFRFKINS